MNIKINAIKASKANNNLIVLVRDADFSGAETEFNKEQKAFIKNQLESSPNDPVVINQYNRYVFVVNTGSKSETSGLEDSRKAGAKIASALKMRKLTEVSIVDYKSGKERLFAFCEGLILAAYGFGKYLTDKKATENNLKEINICGKIDIAELKLLTSSVYTTRNLVNEPFNNLNQAKLAEEATRIGLESGFKTEVFNKKKIETLKMGGLLAVNQGSQNEPVFIVAEYKPKGHKNKKPIVFVGKGVVYDTGGASIKTAVGMVTMKCDMAGAAAVIGTMKAIAEAKLPVYAVGLIPATDNAVDNTCIVPGDIIKMSSGKTVEVLNTDAEGRLILADALHYAKKYNPALVIDLATLTGAAVRAIGDVGIAAMQVKADNFANLLGKAGEDVYERTVWFPMWEEYGEMIKSDVADIKNLGGPDAGQITAAKFLEHFTDYPWIHLDIAGPAFLEKPASYRSKGGTGTGVRLLYQFVKEYMIKSEFSDL